LGFGLGAFLKSPTVNSEHENTEEFEQRLMFTSMRKGSCSAKNLTSLSHKQTKVSHFAWQLVLANMQQGDNRYYNLCSQEEDDLVNLANPCEAFTLAGIFFCQCGVF
jgi:hypothetical protein